jgi:hypothetical protein
MAKNVENSKDKPVTVKIEEPEVSTLQIDPYQVEDSAEDEPELDLDEDFEDSDEEDELDELLADEEEPEQPKKLSKVERKNKALLGEVAKIKAERDEFARKLSEKEETKKEEEALSSKYVDEGYGEAEARLLAKTDIRNSNLEKRLELLEFEKRNQSILAKYPNANIQDVVNAEKSGIVTVAEFCEVRYGNKLSAKDRRAIDALTDSEKPEANNTVSQSMRTAMPPEKSKLSDRQLRAKQQMEKTWNTKMTDKQFLDSYPE